MQLDHRLGSARVHCLHQIVKGEQLTIVENTQGARKKLGTLAYNRTL
jgi:hypothetical protein